MPQVHKTKVLLARQIGAVAREARTRAGITQEEAAERVGIATEVYGRMERGNMLPSLSTLVKLCRALGIDANPLLGFSSSQPPAWLTSETPSAAEPSSLRRLLRTARRLNPRQLSALRAVAVALLPAPDTRPVRSSRRAAS